MDLSRVLPFIDLDMLRELYRKLAHLKPDCLEYPTFSEDQEHQNYSVLVVHLVPLGVQRQPNDMTELVQALRSVLIALATLHSLGFVHVDVRWDNIIVVPAVEGKSSARWCLIDYGAVQRIDAEHTPSHDLAMFATKILTISLAERVGANFSSLRTLLQHPTATVDSALAHPFFSPVSL